MYPDEDGLLIISKKITQTRSISRINNDSDDDGAFKSRAPESFDIHGQHEHQSLLSYSRNIWRSLMNIPGENGKLKKKCGRELPEISGIKGKLDGFSLMRKKPEAGNLIS